MRKFLLLGACIASLLPSMAAAEVTSITTSSYIYLNGTVPDPASPGNLMGYSHFQVVPPSSAGLHFGNTPYGDNQYYQLSVEQSANDIIFANSTSAQGSGSQSTASSAINITFRNQSDHAVNAKLLSSITPGSFGMYMTDPSANPTYDPLTGKVSDITRNVQSTTGTFSDWNGGGSPLAKASFQFAILRDGAMIKDFEGSLQLFLILAPTDPVYGFNIGKPSFYLQLDRNADAQTLNGFNLLTPDGSNSAVAYGWNATDVDVDLGTLAAGASSTLSYITTVDAITGFQNTQYNPITGSFDSNFGSQLMAFSGFGDPIGKQGSISPATNAASLVSSLMTMIMGASDPLGPDLINGVNFSRFKFAIPTFDENACTDTGPCILDVGLQKTADGLPVAYDAITPQLIPNAGDPPPPSAAPEPSVWALMMLAVGGMGAALRRRWAVSRAWAGQDPGRRLSRSGSPGNH